MIFFSEAKNALRYFMQFGLMDNRPFSSVDGGRGLGIEGGVQRYVCYLGVGLLLNKSIIIRYSKLLDCPNFNIFVSPTFGVVLCPQFVKM